MQEHSQWKNKTINARQIEKIPFSFLQYYQVWKVTVFDNIGLN